MVNNLENSHVNQCFTKIDCWHRNSHMVRSAMRLWDLITISNSFRFRFGTFHFNADVRMTQQCVTTQHSSHLQTTRLLQWQRFNWRWKQITCAKRWSRGGKKSVWRNYSRIWMYSSSFSGTTSDAKETGSILDVVQSDSDARVIFSSCTISIDSD